MSTTVLPQLQAIEAQLASQESQIAAQLASIREQLSGIRTVMPMFTGSAAVTEDPAISSEKPEEDKSFGEEATVVEEPVAEKAIVSEAPKATKAGLQARKRPLRRPLARKHPPKNLPLRKTAEPLPGRSTLAQASRTNLFLMRSDLSWPPSQRMNSKSSRSWTLSLKKICQRINTSRLAIGSQTSYRAVSGRATGIKASAVPTG